MQEALGQSIRYLKGVGEKKAAMFARLGVFTIGDLLHLYPRLYEDRSQLVSIADAPDGERVAVCATVITPVQEHRIRKGMTLYKFTVSDGSAGMHITLFNNKYLAATVRYGEQYVFFGVVEHKYHQYEMTSPAIAPAVGGARIRPIYPQTAGLNTQAVERAVRAAFDAIGDMPFEDILPEDVRRKHDLLSTRDAIRFIHFPPDSAALKAARDRLVFEELFVLQLGLLRLKGCLRSETAVTVSHDCTEEYCASLPFTLTGAQRRALDDCTRDMTQERPMNRLIQGDVGSGKTAVAAGVAFNVIKNGWQAALMAPTEILATQHKHSLQKLLIDTDIRVELLVGSMTAAQKRRVIEATANGEVDLLVGTHALLSDKVSFDRLGLVITDEQHRFGVKQRAALSSKGVSPHRLVMSATPIPRTLALMIYGDLDVSVLDELPPGRQPIATFAIGSDKRERALRYVEKFLSEGRQGYIVCPLIAEDEDDPQSELLAAEDYFKHLQRTPLGRFRIGLLHGRMKGAEKDAVMTAFAAHELDLLVSTTVIEVGVDVSNAVIMIIENAERFGLAQMHQLRGRVGRGEYASTCILISDNKAPDTVFRMKVMAKETDGFRIAEEDLKLRGPGDFFGNRQHGLPALSIADLKGDMMMLQKAQEEAVALSKCDPGLNAPEHRSLSAAVSRLFAQIGEDGMN